MVGSYKQIVEKVDTDVARTVASNLKTINSQMRDGLETVCSAISELEISWSGSAVKDAIKQFDKIKDLSEARYDVMDGYANFLFQQIGEGYEKTGRDNKSLADLFK